MSAKKKKKLNSLTLKAHMEEMEVLMGRENSWPFRSVPSGWPVFDEVSGGVRDRIYLVAGGAGSGKTSYICNMMFNLLKENEEMIGMILSLDQSYLDLVARFFAMSSNLSVEKIRDPSLIKDEDEQLAREEGLKYMERVQERLLILDQSKGCLTLEEFIEEVEGLRSQNPETPLVVAVDPVMHLRVMKKPEGEDKSEFIISELKAMARRLKVGLVLTAHLEGAGRNGRPTLKEMDKFPGLIYGSDFVGLLYNEALDQFETPFLEWEWATEDTMIPVVELNIVKNKNSDFLGRVWYWFYNSATRYRECSHSENDHYNEMLGNLNYFDDPKGKNKDLKKRVYKAPERKYEPIF